MYHFFLAMKKYKIWKNCPTSADQKPLQHLTFGHRHILSICVQAALVIYNLFICDFSYTRLRNGLFSRTYPLIYSNLWSFNMQIHYMSAYFLSPYLLHIMTYTCTYMQLRMFFSETYHLICSQIELNWICNHPWYILYANLLYFFFHSQVSHKTRETWAQFLQHVYEQLLLAKIPKA